MLLGDNSIETVEIRVDVLDGRWEHSHHDDGADERYHGGGYFEAIATHAQFKDND